VKFKSLEGKFLAPSIALVFIGMTVSMLTAYVVSSNAIEKSINDQGSQLSLSIAKDAFGWLKAREGDVMNWSRSKSFISAQQVGFIGKAGKNAASKQMLVHRIS
jgi:hypothetical protein